MKLLKTLKVRPHLLLFSRQPLPDWSRALQGPSAALAPSTMRAERTKVCRAHLVGSARGFGGGMQLGAAQW